MGYVFDFNQNNATKIMATTGVDFMIANGNLKNCFIKGFNPEKTPIIPPKNNAIVKEVKTLNIV